MQSVVDWIINKDKEIPDNTTIVQQQSSLILDKRRHD